MYRNNSQHRWRSTTSRNVSVMGFIFLLRISKFLLSNLIQETGFHVLPQLFLKYSYFIRSSFIIPSMETDIIVTSTTLNNNSSSYTELVYKVLTKMSLQRLYCVKNAKRINNAINNKQHFHRIKLVDPVLLQLYPANTLPLNFFKSLLILFSQQCLGLPSSTLSSYLSTKFYKHSSLQFTSHAVSTTFLFYILYKF